MRLFIVDDDVGMDRDGVWEKGSYWLPWFKFTDPDGGLELIYILREPNVTVLGVTTMMGVVTADVAVSAAKKILTVLDRDDVPVLPGAQIPADLGKETAASRFIVDMVRKYPGRVEIIATGPLTNIATAMMMEPELPKLWHTLHFATGEFLGKLGKKSKWFNLSFLGISDLNINIDPVAAEYVLKYGGSFPIYPNELMDDVVLERRDHEKIRKTERSKRARFIAYELAPLNFLTKFFNPWRGIPVHGAVAVGLILNPKLRCKTIESAIVMKKYGYRGYAFELSDDPVLPKHKIHFHLDKVARNQIHKRLLERILK